MYEEDSEQTQIIKDKIKSILYDICILTDERNNLEKNLMKATSRNIVLETLNRTLKKELDLLKTKEIK